MYREISSRRFSLCHSDRKMNAGRLFPEPKGRCGSRACAPTCTNTFNGPRLGNLLSDVPSTFVAHAGMADVAYTDVFEPAFNSCCDACSCSDAVRQQGWQTLQELRRQKDIFTDGQVWLVWHSRPRGYKRPSPLTACAHAHYISSKPRGPWHPAAGRRLCQWASLRSVVPDRPRGRVTRLRF